jgi:proteasome lid subunit RPN8/RPN11
MRHPDEKLFTPLYVKTDPALPWPEDEGVFYVLGSNGLFLCRNHPFFRSSVPARGWPSELAFQDQHLDLHHPMVPREQLELMVGFFSRVADLHDAEAVVLLLWDRQQNRLMLRVPAQRARVSEGWTGDRYPLDIKYTMPTHLGRNVSLVGTAHSHVDAAAYASTVDRHDELYLAGLHIVVGRIQDEPPEFHCEFVVDGTRFRVEPAMVLEPYRKRRTDVPKAWLDRVSIKLLQPLRASGYGTGGYGAGSYGSEGSSGNGSASGGWGYGGGNQSGHGGGRHRSDESSR